MKKPKSGVDWWAVAQVAGIVVAVLFIVSRLHDSWQFLF